MRNRPIMDYPTGQGNLVSDRIAHNYTTEAAIPHNLARYQRQAHRDSWRNKLWQQFMSAAYFHGTLLALTDWHANEAYSALREHTALYPSQYSKLPLNEPNW